MNSRRLNTYLCALYALTILCFYSSYTSFRQRSEATDLIGIAFFIILSIITESLSVGFRKMRISSGFAINFASIILFGTFGAMITVCTGVALRVYKKGDKYIHIFNTPLYKTLFNISNLAISIYCASNAYYFFKSGLRINLTVIMLIQAFMLIFIFLLVNTFIMSILMAILSEDSLIKSYWNTFKFGFLNIIAMAPFGYVLAYLYYKYNIIGIIVVMIPVLLARYTYTLYIETKTKYMETVKALMHAVEARDKYTEGHSRNVAEKVEKIARELKYSENRIEQLIIASYLHDIGKIGVDDRILNKPDKLTHEEFEAIKAHPEIGYNIVKDIKDLDDIPLLVRYHHERYDGGGYPTGKKADELSRDVFILQLADAVDAMSTDRVYRKALSKDEIKNELRKNSGTQFHPDIVEAYLKIMDNKTA